MGGCIEVPKCCVESEIGGGGEDEGSVVWDGMAVWEEEGEDPEVTVGWRGAAVVMLVSSSSSSEISMSSPEE